MDKPLYLPPSLRGQKPAGCHGCHLEYKGSSFIPGSGWMGSRLLVVGDVPGEADERTLSPFHVSGQSGAMLNRAIKMVASVTGGNEGVPFDREQLHVLNAINCRPPYSSYDGAWAPPVVDHCYNAHVGPAIVQRKPGAILALGNTALRQLTGFGHGKKSSIAQVRGYYLEGNRPELQGIPIVASLSPAFILKAEKPSLLHILASDIRRALRYATHGAPKRPHDVWRHWKPVGTPEDLRIMLRWLRDNPLAPAGYDIETEHSKSEDESTIRGTEDGRILTWKATTGEDFDRLPAESVSQLVEQLEADGELPADVPSVEDTAAGRWAKEASVKITQVQIALSREWSVAWLWTPEIAQLFFEFLALPNPKYTWNGRLFDNPILRAHGAVIGGAQVDCMNVSHHYFPDWPMGLQSMVSHCWPEHGPWKHLAGQDDGFYGCADASTLFAVVDQKSGIASKAMPYIVRQYPDAIERVERRISEDVIELGHVLDRIQDHGIPVDRAKQQAFKTYIERTLARLNRHLQHYITKASVDIPALQQWHKDEGYPPATNLGKRLEWAVLGNETSITHEGRTYYLNPCETWEEVPVLNEKGKPTRKGGKMVTERQLVQHPGFRALVPKPRLVPKDCNADRLQLVPIQVTLNDPYAPAKSNEPIAQRSGIVWRWNFAIDWNPNSSAQILTYLRERVAIETAQLRAENRAVRRNAVWYVPENPNERGKDWTGTKGLAKLIGYGPKAWRLAFEMKELDDTERNTRHKTELDKWKAKRAPGDLYEATDGRVLVRNYDRALDSAGAPAVTRDPVLHLVTKIKDHTKLRGFAKAWEPGPDGCVHTSFGFGPATGQLSSKNPNTTQGPKHGKLAHLFKGIIVARSGRKFINADWSGFHAVTTGFEANLPSYVRLARLDIHSFLTAHGEGIKGADYLLEYSDYELAQRLDAIKKKYKVERDTKYKRLILGVQFGMRAGKMSRLYPETFPTWKDAQRVWDVEYRIWPELFAWQDSQRAKADRQKFLLTKAGFIRWFWSVYQWSSQYQKVMPGPDSEKCVAYEPANVAFVIVRKAMRTIANDRHPKSGEPMGSWLGLMNNVHDSLEAETPTERFDEAVDYLADVMTRPYPLLTHPTIAPQGLWCDVEVSGGPDMNSMEKILATRDRWLKAP
jgi:uracil-DNA glycosylase family 4